MSDRPFSPEEFVRLLALPEDHPERRQAEVSGKLDAWRRMLHEFEEPGAGDATATELARADAVMAQRVESMLGTPTGVPPGAARPASGGPSLLAWLASIWSRPALRPAFAMAALMIVAGTSWWMVGSRAPRAVRGVSEDGIVVETRETSEALELTWAPVPGAEHYRIRFFGPALREIARRDDVVEPRLRFERGALPAGIASGEEVVIDVAAMRGNDALAVSKARAVRMP